MNMQSAKPLITNPDIVYNRTSFETGYSDRWTLMWNDMSGGLRVRLCKTTIIGRGRTIIRFMVLRASANEYALGGARFVITLVRASNCYSGQDDCSMDGCLNDPLAP